MVENLKITQDWLLHPDFNKAVEYYKKLFPNNEAKARQLAQISLFQKYKPDEYNKAVKEFIKNMGEPTEKELRKINKI